MPLTRQSLVLTTFYIQVHVHMCIYIRKFILKFIQAKGSLGPGGWQNAAKLDDKWLKYKLGLMFWNAYIKVGRNLNRELFLNCFR